MFVADFGKVFRCSWAFRSGLAYGIIFPGLPAPVAVTSVFWVCGDGKSAGGVPTSETCMIY